MINSPKEAEFPLKQEGLTCDEKAKASSSSSSAQWLKLKDPRIVRVSRAFGGKDRHSKVCTIRGLRDRRVRLSVPTAIHLYDLQDRLGLNQPSKVVDWLLNAAKHEIDELPPLPIPPGNFTLGYPSLATSKDVTHQNTSIWKSKSKDQVSVEMSTEKENWMNRNEGDKQGSNDCSGAQQHVLPNNNSNLLPTRANHHHHHPSFLGLLNTMPLGYQLDPSADVTQLANLGFVNHQTDIHSINVVPFPSTLSLSSGNTSQILVCPTGATQPYFPSHVAAMEMDPRQINHYQMLSSSSSQNLLSTNSLINNPSQHLMSQSGKPFSLGRMTAPKLLHSPNRGQDFPSK